MDKIKTTLEWHDINTDEIEDGGWPVLAVIEQTVRPDRREDAGYEYAYAFRMISFNGDQYFVEGQGERFEAFEPVLENDGTFCRQRIICWAELPSLNHHVDHEGIFQKLTKAIGLI